jgi:uncharacterized protein
MRYNVAQLMRQPTGATRHYQLNEPSGILDPALDLVGPLHGSVHLLRTQRGILVTADLTQAVQLECVRCLAGVHSELAIRIEEEFLPTTDLKTGAHIDWSAEEDVQDSPLIDEKHILDLTESVRQELLVNLPIHVLCRPDCRGICPECGADRNTEPCQCDVEPSDPRWASLDALKAALEAKMES